MFRFPDVTSLLSSSPAQNWTKYAESLGMNPVKNSQWNSLKLRDWKKKKLKLHACIRFCSYYRIGVGVVQMVHYSKMSRIISVILNGHFKSELRWRTKPTSHKTYHIRGKNGHFFSTTQDILHRICHGTYMALRISRPAKKIPQVPFHHEIRLDFTWFVIQRWMKVSKVSFI